MGRRTPRRIRRIASEDLAYPAEPGLAKMTGDRLEALPCRA
jgi:hypothetical protein